MLVFLLYSYSAGSHVVKFFSCVFDLLVATFIIALTVAIGEECEQRDKDNITFCSIPFRRPIWLVV